MPGASIRSGHGLTSYIRAMVRQRLTSGRSAMPDLHSLPVGTRPTNAIRNNGPDDLVLERFKLRELAEGWPMYRCVAIRSCSIASAYLAVWKRRPGVGELPFYISSRGVHLYHMDRAHFCRGLCQGFSGWDGRRRIYHAPGTWFVCRSG